MSHANQSSLCEVVALWQAADSFGSMRVAEAPCLRTIGAACSRADLPARQMFPTITFVLCVGAATILNAGCFYAMPKAQPSYPYLGGATIRKARINGLPETSCSSFGVEFILCSTNTLVHHRFLLLRFLLSTDAAFIIIIITPSRSFCNVFILCSTSTLARHQFLLLLFLLPTGPVAAFQCSK